MRTLILFLLFNVTLYSQNYKDKISIVQYSADFSKDGELSLDQFKKYNTFKFNLETDQEIFNKDKISFVPTIIIYHNGNEIKRFEAGISLKLDPKCIGKIQKEIDGLLSSKF